MKGPRLAVLVAALPAGAPVVLTAALAAAAPVVLAAALAAPPPAAAQPATPADPGSARIVGQFQMAGRVTVAHDISGERVGQTANRVWTFTPQCPSGACPTIGLVRNRAKGSDTLTLSMTSPGSYQGNGLFYAPLRCGGRRYKKGEAVPFTIIVHVTAAALIEGVDVATNVYGEYINHARRNLTRCVEIPGHDAAQYFGQLLPPPSGGASPVSDRSPARS